MEEDIINIQKATSQLVQGINRLLIKYLDEINIPFRPVTILKAKTEIDMKIDPKDMVEILDEILNDKITYPNGIKTNSRRRKIVMFRQIGCKLLRDMGYTCEEIAKKFGLDHATVIHSGRSVNNLLEIKDQEMTLTYTNILFKIKSIYNNKYGANILLPDPPQVNSKPIIPSLVNKKRSKLSLVEYSSRNEAAIFEFLAKGGSAHTDFSGLTR